MNSVPWELQVMVLERTCPRDLFSVHRVKKDWKSFILKKDHRLRQYTICEEAKIKAIMEPEWRSLDFYIMKQGKLAKKLKLTEPRMKRLLGEVKKKKSDELQAKIDLLDVLNEKLRNFTFEVTR